MERSNYLEKLQKLTVRDGNKQKTPKLPALAIDTETDKGTQTNPGFWIGDHSISGSTKRSIPPPPLSPQSPSEAISNSIQKQVHLTGYVNVQRSDLIPDGRGGYFVHVTSKDIQRADAHPTPKRHNRSNHHKRPNHQNMHAPPPPYNMQPQQQRFTHPPPKAPYMQQRPRYQDDPMPYANNFGEEMFRMQTMQSRYNSSLPNGNSNLAEDLLSMQNKPRGPPRRRRFDQQPTF